MKIPSLVLVLTVCLASVVGGDCLVGDLNGDCEVNLQDLRIFAEQWLEPSGGSADLTGDDEVGMADFALLANMSFLSPLLLSEWRSP